MADSAHFVVLVNFTISRIIERLKGFLDSSKFLESKKG